MAIVYSGKIERAGAFEMLGTTKITVTAHDGATPAIVALGMDSGSVACRAHITPAAARETAAMLIEAADAAEAPQAVAA